MPNLIDQMNILKGLSDQQLGTEMQQPSGAVPPYLVMSELNRRKDMRQRYAGQEAQRRPQTTVAQDQLSALAPMPPMGAPTAGAPPAGMPMAPGTPPGAMGIAAAPPPAPMGAAPAPAGYAHGGIVGYANGGVVDLQMPPGSPTMDPAMNPASYGITMPVDSMSSPALAADGTLAGSTAAPDNGTAAVVDAQTSAPLDPGYAGIAARVEQELQQEQRAREQAPWLGLLQGGLAVAGGTSPNALTNIGTGAQTGVDAYKTALQSADSGTSTNLNNLVSLQTASQDYNFKKQAADLEQQKYAASMDPNSPANLPTAIREANYINSMPTDTPAQQAAKDAAMKIITPFAAQTAAAKEGYAETIADGVHNGTIDPGLQGMYSIKPQVMAALATKYPDDNLAQMQQMASAATANVKAMNGPGQLKLRQGIDTLIGSNGNPGILDQLQSDADAWNAGGYPALNGINLNAALQGALGPDAQAKAAKFKAELAEASPAMSSVFSGGNSPTDKALANAQDVFSDNTSALTFDKLAEQARLNLKYRAAALDQAPAGPAGNRYNFTGTGATPGTSTAPPAVSGTAAVTAPPSAVDYKSYFGAQ